MKLFLKSATLWIILLISFNAFAFGYGYGEKYPVQVLYVNDGDTITVLYNGNKEKVRFLEVDTFEVYPSKSMASDVKQFNLPEERLKSLGVMGSHLTKALIQKGDTVWLSFEGKRRGYYGRLLAFVHLKNGAVVNELLVRDGMAMVYRGARTSLHESYLYAEAAARGSNLGIWGTPEVRQHYQR